MDLRVRIDVESHTAHVVATGDVGPREFSQALREVWLDPDHDSSFRLLVDLTQGTLAKWRALELDATLDVAREVAVSPRRGRAAVVVGTEVDYGLVRVLLVFRNEKLREDPEGPWGEMEVFRDTEEAREWLADVRRA